MIYNTPGSCSILGLRPLYLVIIIFVLAMLLIFSFSGCSKKSNPADNGDSSITADTLYIDSYRIDSRNYGIDLIVVNAEELDALSIPLKFSANQSGIVADSTIFRGSRVEDFRLQIVSPDTLTQCLTIALFTDLGNAVPPLSPGRGLIARVYVSSLNHTDISGLAVDTTTTPPSNSLMLINTANEAIIPTVIIR